MVTSYSSRSSVTTSYNGRDPVGIVYLTDDLGNILTDDFGEGLYVSQQNTQYTGRASYTGQTWNDLGSQTWSSLGSMTWNDLFTGPVPPVFTGRIIP